MINAAPSPEKAVVLCDCVCLKLKVVNTCNECGALRIPLLWDYRNNKGLQHANHNSSTSGFPEEKHRAYAS